MFKELLNISSRICLIKQVNKSMKITEEQKLTYSFFQPTQHVLDLELAVLSQIEPEQCFRRLVCDLATGQMPPSQNDLIVSLFEDVEDIDITSALFEYTIASKLGKVTGDITSCELRYRCSFTGAQILETAARR